MTSGVHPLVVGVLPGRRSRVRVTTSDPRWQRGDGGWWHWPEGATGWQWIPDPPPAPNALAADLERDKQKLARQEANWSVIDKVGDVYVWALFLLICFFGAYFARSMVG